MRLERIRNGLIFSIVLLIVCGGCLQPQRSTTYRTIRPIPTRDSQTAKEANERGLQHIENESFDLAEAAFRDALRADVGYASAHNNLGLVLLEKKKFYESALEFKFASKLNPKATEPILNLGRLYETIGWKNAAINQYNKALEIHPENKNIKIRLVDLIKKQ